MEKLPHLTVKFRDKDGTENTYEGVEVVEVLKDAGLVVGPHPGKAMAAYVSTVATDGYQVVFGLGELIRDISGRTVVLAYSENGKPLGDNVGPVRLIVADDKVQARCIRMVTELKFVELRK